MWYWIIKVSILSLVFIFLLHYLYTFFISTLTIPKVKDLVTLPQQKYDELFHSLEQNKSIQSNNGHNGNDNLPLLPSSSLSSLPSSQSMKDELIRFMKEIGGGGGGSGGSGSNKNDATTTISSYSFSK
jgi:uncharacterized membrane protein YgcG